MEAAFGGGGRFAALTSHLLLRLLRDLDDMAGSERAQVQAILAGARAEHGALLDQLSPALQASLPVDATGITQAIEHLGELVGLSEELRREQKQAHTTNPAVLHGRVFGRAPLSSDTVLAAFADAAHVREQVLTGLAVAIGGTTLEEEIRSLLEQHPPWAADDETSETQLRDAYAAQEEAVLRIAAHVDGAP